MDEFFRECEDLHMQPLYDINSGMALGSDGSTNNTVPMDQMGPWVQDAMDFIEYANGDTNTTWGALRAANGHPAPYNLRYLEIGNESGGTLYDQRYALFYAAIKSNYPAMHLIVPDWGGIPSRTPVEIQDEHYFSHSHKPSASTRGVHGPRLVGGSHNWPKWARRHLPDRL